MRRRFIAAFALVEGDDVLVVDRQAPVRVDGDAEKSGVRLRHTHLDIHISRLLYGAGDGKFIAACLRCVML